MIPKRKTRPKMGVRQEPQIRCPGHLAWVRGHECACAGKPNTECVGKIEAAHVRVGTDGGMSLKPGDNFSIPLCSRHHMAQHQWGEKTFEGHYRINMKQLAADLWQKSPHRAKYLARSPAVMSPDETGSQNADETEIPHQGTERQPNKRFR